MNFLLFGTGDYFHRYKKWFLHKNVLALLDNSVQKQNTYLDGVKILSPQEGIKLPYDVIVILSFHIKVMKVQLMELGVPEDRIYHFYDVHSLLQPERMDGAVKYLGGAESIVNASRKDRKVLLLSQELSLGGPSIALFHAADVLKRNEYEVVFGSMMDGPLKEKLLANGIPVIIDSNLQVATMREVEWTNGFSMLICNTLNFHIFLMERNKDVPVIWWLHDAPFFYEGVRVENFRRISRDNLKVVSVGPIPRKAITRFMPEICIEDLLYGVEDQGKERYAKKHLTKVRFVLIGFFEDIKGQDILLKAVEALPHETKDRIEVLLVGHDATLYAQELKEKYRNLHEVQYMGSVDREKIHEILRHADILVCPSRQDSMPTVAAEAMMHRVPCIVSDATGTAEYIEDGRNGFVFHSENTEELALKMRWCVEHCDELPKISIEARKIYEKYFSKEIFEQNLLEIVRNFQQENSLP